MPDISNPQKPVATPADSTAATGTHLGTVLAAQLQDVTPVERAILATVNGQLGVFTPLTHAAGAPPDPNADKNVDLVMASLRSEIAKLQEENQGLQGQLDRLLSKPTAPEDFGTALQQSLDKLQTLLYSMTNPVSNFAVKEFRLETNVEVTVTPLGTVEYRFIPFDRKVDPGALSRLTLQLVPVPKQTTANTFTSQFQPQLSVAAIEGLTADQQDLLHRSGIDTVGDFLSVGTRARSSVELLALLKLDRANMAALVASSQLLTLKGVDGPRAAVLIAAGIDSLEKIAGLKPDDLIKRFNEQRTTMKRNDAAPLDAAGAAAWVAAAAAFLGSEQS